MGDDTGNAIDFTASIDDAKKVITLNPNADLAEGAVYVAVSAEHWDAAGNKGSQHTATFTVDTIAPAAPQFSPANAATVSDASTDITIAFAEALRKDATGTALENADLAAILTLKATDDSGAGIDFAATIDEAKKVITLNPDADLDPGKVYVAISADHWDAAGNKGSAHTATFTVDTAAPTVAISGVPEAINAATAFTATFTFSEDVTGFATGDVTVTGGAKGTFEGSGKSYTLAVTPGGTTDVVVTVAADAATDGANLGPPQAVAATARWDTAAPAAPTFSPAGGDTVTDDGTDITITFNEALRRDGDGTAFTTEAHLKAILTLKTTNDSGTPIPYAATIDDARKVITLDPTSDLAEGAVYVAVSADHWDAAGNQGSAHTATFTVDVTGPAAPDFSPANAATVTDASTNITITFAEAITKNTDADALADGDLAAILTLTEDDETGTAIPFAATIDQAKKVITLNPDADLPEGAVYVAISADHFDAAGIRGSARTATFTVDTVAPTVAIGGVPEAINAATAFTATFTFSEDVTGFATGDVTVTGGTKGTFQGSGKSYTLLVTPSGRQDVTVTVAADAATDGAHQGPAEAVAATARWDTTAPAAPTFSPENGAAVRDAATDITISFAEALRKDVNGTALENADLAAILTLKVGDNDGNAIGFAATIDDARKVITLNPTSNLAEGAVYVAISAEHWDAAGNKGSLRSATFTVDETAPAAPQFSPANAAAVSDASTDITITFAEALRKDANGTALNNVDLANILTLAKDDQNGDAIGFAATIDTDKKVITLNPDADLDPGKVYVAISADHFDAAGNQGSPHTATFTVDTAAPTLTITGVPEAINATDAFTATFTFSEDVTGFATGDVTVTGGAKGTFEGSGKSYTLVVTPGGTTDVVVTVAADAATDGANLGPPQAVAATARWDTAAPAAPTFSPANEATVNTPATDITITFDEALRKDANGTPLANADLASILTLKVDDDTGAAIDFAATIDTDKKVITLDPANDLDPGKVYVAVSAEHWDAAGNKGSPHTATFTVDTAAPTLTIGGVPEAINATDALDVTFTFSEDVTGFDADDVTVTGGAKGTFEGSGKSYTLAVTPGGTADVVVTVRANAATDGANQGPAQAVAATATWDTTAPAAPEFSPADGASVKDVSTDITLTFAEAVKKSDGSDFSGHAELSAILTLKAGGSGGTAIDYAASIDSANKVITINPDANLAEGEVYVAVSAGYHDAIGNPGAMASATFTVDLTAPAAPEFSPADGASVKDVSTDITLTFAEALRKDASGTALANDDLAAILTLKVGDDSGDPIDFAATIDADKKVITLDPANDLDPGKVYVAISDDLLGTPAGNRGVEAAATFTVDLTPPAAPEFSPVNGHKVQDPDRNIMLTFAEAVKKSDGSDFSGHAELSSILALKVGDSDGEDIDYAASINGPKTVITLDPSSDLPAGAVYAAVTGGYHDAAGNQGPAASVTFTVRPVNPTDLTVTAGDTKLDLSWTAPAGTVTGYDVHYTSAPSARHRIG